MIPARYILAILGSIGMAIVYGLKVNLSVVMVAMLNHTAIKQLNSATLSSSPSVTSAFSSVITTRDTPTNDDTCSLLSASPSSTSSSNVHEATTEDGPFAWSEPLQGIILSCYFWGYIVSQIPGARLAERVSAKYVMLFSVAINVVCTLLTPLMANLSYMAMIMMRICEGLGGGVTFPAMHVMIAAWSPPSERSTMASVVYAGTSLGTVASMLMSGLLAGTFGWQSVFYVMGGLSSVWIVLWMWLVQDRPTMQSLISAEERAFIAQSLGEQTSANSGCDTISRPTPWRAILRSGPFWAILVAHVCSNWGWYMLLIELPFYMKQVLKFNIEQNALATSLPFLMMWLFSIALSQTLDALRHGGHITTTTARRVATIFASAVPAGCMLALCFVECQHRGVAVLIMGIAITSIGGMFSGFLSNHIDLASNFAGTLMAITNTAATVPGIVVPLFVGWITQGNVSSC